MSIQSFMPRMCKGPGRCAFAILLGALLALQCLLPSLAFARSSGQTTAFSLNPANHVRDKVGVSVVRLVAIYGNGTSKVLRCSSLGMLVSSQSVQVPQKSYQNTVLADGTLINTTMASCGAPGGDTNLSEIQVWASNEYAPTPVEIGDLQSCEIGAGGSSTCQNKIGPFSQETLSLHFAKSEAYALFPFLSTYEQPYLSIGAVAAPPVTQLIGLTSASSQPLGSGNLADSTFIQGYLHPNMVSPSSAEGGTPVVDDNGGLAGMYLNDKKELTTTDMAADLPVGSPGVSAPSASSLTAGWDTGIDDYYAGNNRSAVQAFNALTSRNPDFKAPQTFAQQAQAASNPATPTSKNATPGSSTSNSNSASSLWLLIGLGAALIALILLLVLVTMLVGRIHKRRELEKFTAEHLEAQRQAEEEIQRQRAHSPGIEVPCPNCRQPVRLGDTVCPNCNFPLSPSDSGYNVRLAGSRPLPPLETRAPAPPFVPSISEQPTVQFPPPPPAPSTDAPVPETTVKGRSSTRRKQQPAQEKQSERSFTLAVGTRSDPGLKRKYKPNEDSLFAVQGARTHNSQPQQFGFFVVADGMGGHAKGQDASRQAIQTMIDFMLPRISSSDPMDDEMFTRLLGEGVQQANQAVHQRNLEAHADMGTTMTTSLVVGSTAYVANVGDSRTYLYRRGQLSKVTNDHSVVASLVEAGIIQPDDIYTHPKRNQIYRSLGEKPVVEVDTFKVELQAGDVLLLCSDGLWDMVRDPKIQQVLSKTGDPNKTTQELIKAALEGGGEDNVSVIVVQVTEVDQHTGMTGIQILTKPETVTVPNLPPVG